MEMCPTARNFFARQGDLTRKSFVDCKENQRGMAEKGPPSGLIDMLYTKPKGGSAVGRLVGKRQYRELLLALGLLCAALALVLWPGEAMGAMRDGLKLCAM